MKSESSNNAKKTSSKLIIFIIVIGCLYYLIPIGLFVFAMISDNYTVEYKVLDDGSIAVDKNKLIISSDVKGNYNESREAYYIEGKITNNTDKNYNFLEIKYYLYNDNDEILGEATTYIQNLEAHKTWNFKVTYDDIDASSVAKFEFNPN